MGGGRVPLPHLLKGKVRIPPHAGHFIDTHPPLASRIFFIDHLPFVTRFCPPILQVDIIKNVPLHEKLKSPPPAGPFSTPLLPTTAVPKYGYHTMFYGVMACHTMFYGVRGTGAATMSSAASLAATTTTTSSTASGSKQEFYFIMGSHYRFYHVMGSHVPQLLRQVQQCMEREANCSKGKVVDTNCSKNMEREANCSKSKVVYTNCSKNMEREANFLQQGQGG